MAQQYIFKVHFTYTSVPGNYQIIANSETDIARLWLWQLPGFSFVVANKVRKVSFVTNLVQGYSLWYSSRRIEYYLVNPDGIVKYHQFWGIEDTETAIIEHCEKLVNIHAKNWIHRKD